ncbi:septum formation protein Maf [Rubellimicrobium sp. CFH 75288]|nr:Maf family protein [Rubellimicrobium sp. CFH 75288]NAZ37772.1 septum formation protein Maf [Rubellimicrobium sp. CFH 75288]
MSASPVPLVLASGSATRAAMLRAAGVVFETMPVAVDEAALREALLAEGHDARAVADALAEMKALRASARRPGALCLGADQVLSCDGTIHAKPDSPEAALDQLRALAGRTHRLHSAAVIAEDGRPVWRAMGEARMTMGRRSEAWLQDYVRRHWESIRHSVGGYRIEEEGVRLFERVEGDHWTILGLPLLPLLNFLAARGSIPS